MLEEQYQQRRVLPPHLRKPEPPEAPFEYAIRDARPADLPAVREIYNYYVANSTVTFDEKPVTLDRVRIDVARFRNQPNHLRVHGGPTQKQSMDLVQAQGSPTHRSYSRWGLRRPVAPREAAMCCRLCVRAPATSGPARRRWS